MAEAPPDRPGCTIRALPPEMTRVAAELACTLNPANRPAVAQFASVVPGTESDIMAPQYIAALTTKYWGPKPRVLTVRFLDAPDPETRRLVLGHANLWDCGVTFAETTSEDGDVRLARAPGGYWSYLGTDVRMLTPGRPTMNLQGFTARTSLSEYKRVVTHEFGHTLGFPHEHMRADLVAKLDPARTVAYFGRTQGWSPRDVQLQVLTPLDETTIFGTPPSVDSIMCYQLPGEITTDGIPIPGGDDLTATDLAFADQIYPKATGSPVPPPPPPPPPSPPAALGPEASAEINRERASARLPALAWSPALAQLASDWARSNADAGRLDHGNAGVRIAGTFPGRASGEVIAAGQRTPQEVVAAWMTSPGHRRQVLGEYGLAGVGAADAANGTRYWCADFVAGSHDIAPPDEAGPPVEPPPVDPPPVEPPVVVPPPGEISGPHPLTVGDESGPHRMKPNQSFVFSVKVRRKGEYAAATRSGLDLKMDLYGDTADGEPIRSDDDSGRGGNPLVSAPLTRGKYHLLVKGAYPDVSGFFKVRFVEIP